MITVVVPTKNRPELLENTLLSLRVQTTMPGEVILIDDGKLDSGYVGAQRKAFKTKGIGFRYIQKLKSGLDSSRVLGALESRFKYVMFLDDDIWIHFDFIKRLLKRWSFSNSSVKPIAGISGMLDGVRSPGKIERLFNKIFFLTSKTKWDVTDVGYQVWDQNLTNIEFGYYINGGLSCLTREYLMKSPYKQFTEGRSPGDDVDLCWRAKKEGYHFLIDPDLRGKHQPSTPNESPFLRGVKEGRSQVLIFRSNVARNTRGGVPLRLLIKFLWSSLGWILRQFLTLNLKKGCGMLLGYMYVGRTH